MSNVGEVPSASMADAFEAELELFTRVREEVGDLDPVPEYMYPDVMAAAEQTLSYGNDGILVAAEELDALDHPVLADVEVEPGTAWGKLMDLYRRCLAETPELYSDNPEAAEEWARLITQHVYARRRFAVTYADRVCSTTADVGAIRSTPGLDEAAFLTSSLVTRLRPHPRHIPESLWYVI